MIKYDDIEYGSELWKLADKIEMDLVFEMCRACPYQHKCHKEECETCDEFDEQLDKNLMKVGIER